MSENILIIDGMYLIFSSFYSHQNMRTLKGEPTGAIYGFIMRIENLVKELKPDRIIVAFDTREKTFRHKLFPDYKAKRPLPPEELIQQIPKIKEYLNVRGIDSFEKSGFEADDIIAEVSIDQARKGNYVVIFTADKDLFQLVSNNILIFHPKFKQKLDKTGIKEYIGVFPEQIVDYLSLKGDSSDNIPGVPGIGEKTALKLIEKFGSLNELLDKIEHVDEKIRKKIQSNIGLLNISKKLIDLSNIPESNFEFKLDRFKDEINEGLISLYKRLSFVSMLKKIEGVTQKEKGKLNIKYEVIKKLSQLNELKKIILQKKYFSFDIETTDIEFFKSELVGLSISFEDMGYYIPFLFPESEKILVEFNFKDFKNVMREVFENEEIKKSGHNLKFDILNLKNHGIEVCGKIDDSMVMSYLIFPNRRSHKLKDLTREFLNYSQVEYEELTGKGKSQIKLNEVDITKLSKYCIDDSNLSLKLIKTLKKSLLDKKLLDLYKNVEIPLIGVLTDMEYTGVGINIDFLKSASKKFEHKIKNIEHDIFKMAGYKFNLNSSQQLGELLFEKMNLPVKKRTRKTKSYSTDIEVLKELKSFPVVEKIIDYRTYKKLLSTYLIGLMDNIDKDNRVHTSYNQTVTATGRLSSSNPNLQNIPVGEIGDISVREAFISKNGKMLLSADYSQIELRVMAHFSEDKKLIETFENDFDIHQHTADTVFEGNLFLSKQEKRKRAKIINFSILYGSGPYSLSKELGVSYSEAKNFIDMYFEKYNGVKKFIDAVIQEAEMKPEVKTFAGRKREIPEIQSSNRSVKENGKRMAINTIIQGSAADIIKIVMINIHKKMKRMDSRLILQVHDELVFEYPLFEEEKLFKIVKEEMESAVKLKVPLKVTLKKGKNWGEMQIT